MKQRNWLDLSRKLVDRFDLDFTLGGISEYLGEQALSYFGMGVLSTTTYPTPFPITMSGSILGGTVGNGIAYDPNGSITRIDSSSATSKAFVITTAHATFNRWDLLVIRYKQSGDTPVPKPSDPISTINLNLYDDFELAVIPGTASASPAYPAKGALDIILCGLKVPPNATIGTGVAVDYFVRDVGVSNLVTNPIFVQERPTGTVNGTNQNFVLSQTPMNSGSVLVMLNDLVLTDLEWTIVNKTITYSTAPAPGQVPYVYYVAALTTSQNPLSGAQEVPTGVVNGTNDTFALSNKAANQDSTLVTVDGMIARTTEWNLIQTPNSSSIQFNAGSIPVVGQEVYVFYLINAFSFGQASGALTPSSESFTLDSTDISNKFVTLSHNPANPTTALCDIIGNTGQVYGDDFTISGNQLSWSSLGMESSLVVGSKLRVFYLY